MFLPKSIYIYSAPRVSPQGRHNYSYVRPDGTSVPAGRTFAKQAEKRYSFPLESGGTRLKTGLDELIDNPFQDKQFANDHIKDQWSDRKKELTAAAQITKQMFLEVMHNRKPGTYSPELTAKAFDVNKADASFMERFNISLSDGTNVFSSGTTEGELAMICAYVNPKIAKSKEACNPSQHDFYIGVENEEVVERTSKRSKVAKAVAKLEALKDKMEEFTLFQLAIVLKAAKGPMSSVGVRDRLDDYIWNESSDQDRRIENFINHAKLTDSQEGLVKLYMKYLLQQALNTGVFQVQGGSFYWPKKKHIKNLYNLGTKEIAVLKMLHEQYDLYEPDTDIENIYSDLIEELKPKNVRVD